MREDVREGVREEVRNRIVCDLENAKYTHAYVILDALSVALIYHI